MLEHLKKSFITLTKVSPIAQKLTLPQFLEWKEIMDLMEEGDIGEESILELWQEAVEFERTSYESETSKSKSSRDLPISLQTFLRLNARLDDVMMEINEALSTLNNEDVQEYYKNEFYALTNYEETLSFTNLLQWPAIRDILEEESMTLEEIQTIWKALPKSPQNPQEITLEGFFVLNEEIDDHLSAEVFDGEAEDA
jgi:hypothetical protein